MIEVRYAPGNGAAVTVEIAEERDAFEVLLAVEERMCDKGRTPEGVERDLRWYKMQRQKSK